MVASTQKDLPYSLAEIRKLAKQSIGHGAVTKDYPLDLEHAYKLLNAALATEIMCVLRYRHHQIIAKGNVKKFPRLNLAYQAQKNIPCPIENMQRMQKLAHPRWQKKVN